MNRLIAFRTDNAVKAALQAEANARGVSVSHLIRDMIAKGIGRYAAPAEGRRAA